jgi:hypothetical protein
MERIRNGLKRVESGEIVWKTIDRFHHHRNHRLYLEFQTVKEAYTVGSSDFDIFLEIKYASYVFGLALKS